MQICCGYTDSRAKFILLIICFHAYFSGVEVPESLVLTSSYDLRICTHQIQSLVLGKLNHSIIKNILKSMDVFKDHYTGMKKVN